MVYDAGSYDVAVIGAGHAVNMPLKEPPSRTRPVFATCRNTSVSEKLTYVFYGTDVAFRPEIRYNYIKHNSFVNGQFLQNMLLYREKSGGKYGKTGYKSSKNQKVHTGGAVCAAQRKAH